MVHASQGERVAIRSPIQALDVPGQPQCARFARRRDVPDFDRVGAPEREVVAARREGSETGLEGGGEARNFPLRFQVDQEGSVRRVCGFALKRLGHG
jgi:hypothetical protein